MENTQEEGIIALRIISWIFGLLFLFIGFVNTFWGGDMGFGIFILLLSSIYFLPASVFGGIISPKARRIIKILLGIFIVWAAMGVGELPDKIEMMVNDFS